VYQSVNDGFLSNNLGTPNVCRRLSKIFKQP